MDDPKNEHGAVSKQNSQSTFSHSIYCGSSGLDIPALQESHCSTGCSGFLYWECLFLAPFKAWFDQKKKLFIKISHPLSRLKGDVGSHPPGDARGACADLLRCPWRWKCQIDKLGGETSWTHSRPSSAGQTWAWSPCRCGRCGRAGRGGREGTTLPAAQKASSEPDHFHTQ